MHDNYNLKKISETINNGDVFFSGEFDAETASAQTLRKSRKIPSKSQS